MNWKDQLLDLERNKKWDEAIFFMEGVVKEYLHDLDVYLDMLYLLMNLLVEEDYNEKKHDYYATLLKKYFDESYALFSDNPKYLFFVSRIAYMSEWYFDITTEFVDAMIERAVELVPENDLYWWGHYLNLNKNISENKKAIEAYAQFVLTHENIIDSQLVGLGSLGEYVRCLIMYWARGEVGER